LNYFGEDEEEKSTASAAAAFNPELPQDVVTIKVDRKSSTGSQVMIRLALNQFHDIGI
jgi:hypothetical protein